MDPDGRLFFSHGIDCVRPLDATAIEERENWFADFPGKQPEFAQFLSHGRALKGHYAGRSPQTFLLRRREPPAQIRPGLARGLFPDRPPAPAQLGTQHHRQLVGRAPRS